MALEANADRARMAAAYEAEAARARQWAAIRRREAESEEERAIGLDVKAALLRREDPRAATSMQEPDHG